MHFPAKLVDVVCTDDDSGVNGDVELVIPTTDGADTIFSVSAMEVHVDGSQLDYEALEGTGYVYSLTLLCRDKPTHGKPLTGSVLVSVQVLRNFSNNIHCVCAPFLSSLNM